MEKSIEYLFIIFVLFDLKLELFLRAFSEQNKESKRKKEYETNKNILKHEENIYIMLFY